MAQSLATEDEGVRQPCFTKSAEEPGCRGGVCRSGLPSGPEHFGEHLVGLTAYGCGLTQMAPRA